MVGNWRDVALEDVADELTVGYVGSMASEYVEDGIPFLRSLNVEPFRINKNDLKFITPEFHKRIRKSRLRPGDVVIVRTGKPGACSVVPRWLVDANCSDLVIVRCGKQICNRFLAYYVNTVAARHVSAHLVGAVQQHFNVSSARTLRITLPPFAEQEAIAAVLGALDDKLEMNRRMNATLEVMVRALFQSWFVDFDPVRSKHNGRAPAGINETTAVLFPSEFQDSRLGLIPIGWKVGSILEQASLLSGGTPKTSVPAYWDGDIQWVSAKDVSQCGEVFLIQSERRITNRGLQESSTKLIPGFATVIVARGATTGRLTMIGQEMAMNQTCYALSSKCSAHFTLYLQTCDFIDRMVKAAHGSVFDTITTQTFESTEVLLPPKELRMHFDLAVKPYFQTILANLRQCRTLATLRDTLLPKLLSGEIRVSDAEKFL